MNISENNKSRRQHVSALFEKLGIAYELIEHMAMFTAADNDLSEQDLNATIIKNLFLRNKGKSRYYLYSIPINERADLAALAGCIDETRLSFANEQELWEKLHIRKGSVSPLNVIDAPGTDVEILLDSKIFKCHRIGMHPNDNTATVTLTPDSLVKILISEGVCYRVVEA